MSEEHGWTTGAGKSTQGFGPGILCTGKVAIQYDGYSTTKEGTLVIKTYFNRFNYVQKEDGSIWKKGDVIDAQAGAAGAYQDDKGAWKTKQPDEPLMEEQYYQAYNRFVFLRYKVISPVQWYGAEAVAQCKLTGIEFPEGPNVPNMWLVTSGQFVPTLLKFAMASGLKASGFDNSDPGHDPNYAAPYLGTLEFPLTPEQILLKVIHPLLIKHASEGKLAMAEVKERKKETDKSNFLDPNTVQATPDDDAQRIWAQVTAAQQAEQPESLPPFPGDANLPPQQAPAPQVPVQTPAPVQPPAPMAPATPAQPAQPGTPPVDRDGLETRIRSLIAAGKADADTVLAWIDEMGKMPLDPNQSALGSLDAASLQAILGKIQGQGGPKL